MFVIDTSIEDVKILEPKVFDDNRGFFFESYNLNQFNQLLDLDIQFVQDNHSLSRKGTLRGIHYQVNKFEQSKLVRVISGSIFDCAVDLRPSSATFKKWVGIELSAANKKQLWIPQGFGHAFLALEDNTEVIYKTDNFYSKKNERTILWNDPDIAIDWPNLSCDYQISDKDLAGNLLIKADI